MILNNPKYNSLPEQVEQNRKDIQEIKERTLQEVDDFLSTTSTNAVQNRVITLALNDMTQELSNMTQELDNKQDLMTSITNLQIDQLFS